MAEVIAEEFQGSRERLRGAVGDSLVDAAADQVWLVESDGQLVEARLRGGYVVQYLMWLAERPQPALQTLVLERSSMRSWQPMLQQLEKLRSPALSTLAFGPPAGAGAPALSIETLPRPLLAELEHLSVQGRFDGAFFGELAQGPKLKTLTLELGPRAKPLDLGPLSPVVEALEHLEELYLFGPLDADAAARFAEAVPERVEELEVDCRGGPRFGRTSAARSALRESMKRRPDAEPWWESSGDLPPGARLVVEQSGDNLCYASELPSTRVLGRRTTVSPGARVDEQLWVGRPEGLQVLARGSLVVQRCARGVQHEQEIYDEAGALSERRFFEDGRVVRTESVDAPPEPTTGGAPFEGEFDGSSNPRVEVTSSRTFTAPEELPEELAPILIETWGQHAEEASVAGVWALTDDGEFVCYECEIVGSDQTLRIVATHFGDTLVGVGIQEGQKVAELSDGYLSPL